MEVFDPKRIAAQPHEQRQMNVFYKAREFKMRIIQLSAGGELPECQMHDHVIFHVLSGEAEVTVNGTTARLGEGQCLVSPPATFRMTSTTGVRIMGIQIAPSRVGGES